MKTPEDTKEYARAYREKNKEKFRARAIAWYHARTSSEKKKIQARQLVWRSIDNVDTFPVRMVGNAKVRHRKMCAAGRDIQFDITPDYIMVLAILQDGKCAKSGIDLVFASKSNATASIDRKDSSIGYTQSNVQLVTADINIAKNDLSDDAFQKMCDSVSQWNRIHTR